VSVLPTAVACNSSALSGKVDSMTPQLTAQQLHRVRRAAVRSIEAHVRFHEAIREAVAAGHSIRVVAEAAGLGRSRVHQIAREEDTDAG
jgi:hypothetical protein